MEMCMKKVFLLCIAISLIFASTPAMAEGDRVDDVIAFKAKYDIEFDAVLVRFAAAKKKLAFDASSTALIKNSIANLTETRRVIEQNLADPNAPMANVIRLADEQLGMFSLTNFKLDNLMAKVKTVTCVKGKTVKKISAIGTPKCPSGYKKR
jgi:hypothetical protein